MYIKSTLRKGQASQLVLRLKNSSSTKFEKLSESISSPHHQL